MDKIKADKVLFIKLGKDGEYEKECILNEQTLRLGYIEADHNLCLKRRWDKVQKFYTDEMNLLKSSATRHINQIKQFYEENEDTIWITFYANKLWWCRSKAEITLHRDKTKTRPVSGRWSDKDINGQELFAGNISGKLLKTQGFRGTICKVTEKEYILNKINGRKKHEVTEVENAMSNLKEKLGYLIQHLSWQDFETLIDLIFRQAGWQRIGATGKTQKTFDLDLFAPVTGEKAIVQIKGQSKPEEFFYYKKEFETMSQYDKFFYIVHSPQKSLENYENKNKTQINLYFLDKISELTISAGLVYWVINKTSNE